MFWLLSILEDMSFLWPEIKTFYPYYKSILIKSLLIDSYYTKLNFINTNYFIAKA